MLVNVARLVTAYYALRPDPAVPTHRVAFGTSGHRGSALAHGFNEAHILAITQAICVHRARAGITGPLFLGMDTHALSEPTFASALEVLAANGVEVMIDQAGGYTPTPAVSHAIVTHNRGRADRLADGIVVTPSHNPPTDGGFKYNPPHGGPADTDVTRAIEDAANALIADELRGVARVPYERAVGAPTTHRHDYVGAYVGDLGAVLDVDAIRGSRLTVGVDALGGAAVAYWAPIAERLGLSLTVVNDVVDPTFRFVHVDHDGKIRMDCSSPCAMAGLIALRDRFDLALATDTDSDRHGIVTRRAGLLNPNRYLSAAVAYLFPRRDGWSPAAAVGKTVVTSAVIDRVAARLGRRVVEVPVGFKWFVDGLREGALGFAGEESAGASLLRRDGNVWTTDKDGIVLALLAVEMMAVTGRDPGEIYDDIAREIGGSAYERVDRPAKAAQKAALQRIAPRDVHVTSLAGDSVRTILTTAPGNHAPFGGVKVVTGSGWFAARPSGTEDVYKLYAESFEGPEHLRRIQEEAERFLADVFAAAGAS
jgi:phosphoglucomutase